MKIEMTGHKTRSVFDQYNNVTKGNLVEAASKLERYQATRLGWEYPYLGKMLHFQILPRIDKN